MALIDFVTISILYYMIINTEKDDTYTEHEENEDPIKEIKIYSDGTYIITKYGDEK